ncbi:MAG: hypothetical protein ACPGRD_09945, partial [Planktomarina sp.]
NLIKFKTSRRPMIKTSRLKKHHTLRALLTLTLAALIPLNAAHADGVQNGVWCAAHNRLSLIIEDSGIGFNEHTLCDVKNQPISIPKSGDPWVTAVDCRNVHIIQGGISGDGPDFVHETKVEGLTQITLRMTGENSLMLSTSLSDTPMALTRCE